MHSKAIWQRTYKNTSQKAEKSAALYNVCIAHKDLSLHPRVRDSEQGFCGRSQTELNRLVRQGR